MNSIHLACTTYNTAQVSYKTAFVSYFHLLSFIFRSTLCFSFYLVEYCKQILQHLRSIVGISCSSKNVLYSAPTFFDYVYNFWSTVLFSQQFIDVVPLSSHFQCCRSILPHSLLLLLLLSNWFQKLASSSISLASL